MDLAHFNNDAVLNIFDDIPYEFFKHKKEFLGAQKEFISNIKYGRPKVIINGKPSIILCNPDQSWSADMSSFFREWFDMNADYVVIREPFF